MPILRRNDPDAALQKGSVTARKYFWPGCHRMEPYRTLDPEAGRHLPATEAVAERVIVLPTGTPVDTRQIQPLGSIIRNMVIT